MSERFLRSKADRALLYYEQDGECARCGEELPEDWHADHIIPYSETGRTNLHGMQALCPDCNLTKSDNRPALMSDQSRTPSNIVDLSSARDGQYAAVTTIHDRVLNGREYTSVVLPTGYGKSDVIRLSAHALKQAGLVGTSLVLNTTDYLRGQMVEEDSMMEFKKRYNVKGNLRYDIIDEPGLRYHEDDPFLISTTIGLVHHNNYNFCQWIEQVRHDTGAPVALFVDETHSYTDKNKWGDTVCQLQEAGAHCVVLTATPFREDGDSLIGFSEDNIEVLSDEPVQEHSWKEAEDPEKIVVQKWAGMRYRYRLRGDVHVSFQEAWSEDLLCQISHKTIDARLYEIDLDESDIEDANLLLSELPKSRAQQYLQQFCEDPSIVRDGVSKMIKWLRHYRGETAALENTGAIVFTKDDRGADRVNHHPKQVKEEINEQAPQLNVEIATSADDGSDGRELMRDFCDDNSRIDVLVVKQMASEGLDAKRAKIVLDLSNVRTLNSFIQRANRATRPWRGLYTSVLITLKDPKSLEFFDQFVGEQGGATRTELQLVDSWEKDREEGSPDNPLLVDRAVESEILDNKGNRAHAEHLWIAGRILDQFPELVRHRTIPEIVDAGRKLLDDDFSLDEDVEAVENLSDSRQSLRDVFNEVRNRTYGVLKGMGQINDDGQWHSEFNRRVYERASVPQEYWEQWRESSKSLVAHINSEDLLQRIVDAAFAQSKAALGYELELDTDE